MGFINWLKGVINKMFATEAEKAFGIDIKDGTVMDYKIAEWFKTYQGRPHWVDASQRIKTINMANAIYHILPRLSAGISIHINPYYLSLRKTLRHHERNQSRSGTNVFIFLLEPLREIVADTQL